VSVWLVEWCRMCLLLWTRAMYWWWLLRSRLCLFDGEWRGLSAILVMPSYSTGNEMSPSDSVFVMEQWLESWIHPSTCPCGRVDALSGRGLRLRLSVSAYQRIISSTPLCRPNNMCLKCPSVRRQNLSSISVKFGV